MSGTEMVVAICGMVFTFGPIIVLIHYWYRTKRLQHEQIMTMIDRGIIEGDVGDFYGARRKRRKYSFLPMGGLFIGVGFGLFLAASITGIFSPDEEGPFYFGLIFILGGIGYIVGNLLRIRFKAMDEDKNFLDR